MTRRLLPSLAAVLVCLAAFAPPAQAHPFGPPPTARVTADGNTITVAWVATPDDAVAIGEQLGLMPPGSVAMYRQESAAQVAPSARHEARLSASPKLRRYLTEHVVATQAGTPCPGKVPPVQDFVHTGATVVLECPSEVDEATLQITLLHDLNDAYRTVATGQRTDPAQSVFTVEAPRHTWRFGVDPAAGTPLPMAIGMGAVVAVVVAASVLVIARGRRQSSMESR